MTPWAAAVAFLLAAVAFARPATADEIALPAGSLDRTGPVLAIWHPAPPADGTLDLDWTDGFGRLVERHHLDVAAGSREVPVTLDLRRAVVPDNRITARFQPREGAERRSETTFIARPAPGWPGYQVLMWQDESPAALAALRRLGITGTALRGTLGAAGQATMRQSLAAALGWYSENVATDFYASYHRWAPDRAMNWRFAAARALHRATPGDPAAFERTPSLSDPAWLDTVAARLQEAARRQAPERPLFYTLADEAGIADLAAAWDFDLSASSLAAMRGWLQARYGTLAALNQAWGTQFAAWADIRPTSTDAALRSDASVPAWMDFKAWMDVAFARAVQAGTDALHRGDPAALSALEGAQVPGWGGYDYGLLAGAVDVMEIYDSGSAVEIARALNPALRVLTTSSQGGPAERRRLWHEWLLGGQGVVLWDEARDIMGLDAQPGPRGLELAPVWQALRGALGAQWLDAQPEQGRVAILYSQASFRLQWLLDRRAATTPWTDRDAEAEFNDDNAWRAANRRAAAMLAALGVQPRWVTPDALASDALVQDGTRVLVLPDSLGLSDAEVAAIRRFVAAGGLVLADVPPSMRDALGHVRAKPPLADLAATGKLLFPQALRAEGQGLGELSRLLAATGAAPPMRLLNPDGAPAGALDVRVVRSGAVRLIGIQRLDADPGERSVTLRLPEPLWVQPLRAPSPASQTDELTLQVGPVDPVLLALSPAPLAAVTIDGPAAAAAGDLVEFRVGLAGAAQDAARFVGLTVLNPAGERVPILEETVRVPPGGIVWRLRLAVSDPAGMWRVQATDAQGSPPIGVALAVR